MATSVSYNATIAASTNSGDVLAGTSLRQSPGFGVIRILARHAAGAGTVVCDAYRGSDQPMTQIAMQAAAGGPNTLEDTIGEFAVSPGLTLRVVFTETGGVNTATIARIEYHPRRA